MGWSIGYDEKWKRDIGYGVPAVCDHPDCNVLIDRGLAYVCANSEPKGGDGCGLYFCGQHKGFTVPGNDELDDCCWRCREGLEPFTPKPDLQEWLHHKATDPSWAPWREGKEGGHMTIATPLPNHARIRLEDQKRDHVARIRALTLQSDALLQQADALEVAVEEIDVQLQGGKA